MAAQFSRLRFGNLRVTLSRGDDDANWQFCCYIAGEKKQYRQSTKTAILDEAKEQAQNIVVDILSKQRSGQKVFSITLADARRDFLLDLDNRVKREELSEGTATNTARHIEWGLKFLNSVHITANAAMDGIRADTWKGYPDWRLKQKETTRTVIQQELVSIRSLFKFAKDAGRITEANIPKWELEVEKDGVKRRRIGHKEVMESLQNVAKWAKGDERREMFSTVLRTMLSTGMRTGEVLALTGKDIQLERDGVTIHIPKTKTGKERTITVMYSGAVWLTDWYQGHPESEQLFSEAVFYQMLKAARRHKVMTIDPYHCRHQFATTEILKGHHLHMIGRHMGTSTSQLEKTYSQVLTSQIGRQFAKTKLLRNEDGTSDVVKRVDLEEELKKTLKR
jgi:integrase